MQIVSPKMLLRVENPSDHEQVCSQRKDLNLLFINLVALVPYTFAALSVSKVLNMFAGYSTFNNIYYRFVDVIITVISVEIAIIV